MANISITPTGGQGADDWVVPQSPSIDPRHRDLVIRTVLGEAGQEPPEGQAAVAAVPTFKTGTFTCVNGVVSVAFGFTFSSIPKVFVQWNYANPDAGWVVPGSITTTGFQYQNGNSGTCDWLAVTL